MEEWDADGLCRWVKKDRSGVIRVDQREKRDAIRIYYSTQVDGPDKGLQLIRYGGDHHSC